MAVRQTARNREGLSLMGPLTCEQAVRQFFAYLDQALSGEPLHDLEAHLEA